jgi:ABC-2 type transport system ATP-binding protein
VTKKEAAQMIRENKALLTFENVTKTFDSPTGVIHALDRIKVEVSAGRITGLIGPDGAGKTTLMRLAAGLLLPDQGNISTLGLNVTDEALTVQQEIAYMPQQFGLYEDLRVGENLELYADLQGVDKEQRKDRYAQLIKMTGLGGFMDRLAKNLSGGMKQKLGLACVLVRFPRLLLLDEPTVGVDPVSRRELWSIIYRLVNEKEVTIFLSTSYLDEADRCGDVLLLQRGRLLGQGPPEKFSAEMKGRTFQVTSPKLNKRSLQERLVRNEEVMDAIIQGASVRIVTVYPHDSPPREVIEGLEGSEIEAVAPRFEDYFVSRLAEEKGHTVWLPKRQEETPQKKESSEPVIQVREVRRRFGDFYAVKGISFDVAKGEVFGLLGANGAGKSTTFRMLCGLLPPTEGSVRVAGKDLRKAAASARANIGYMAQKFSLYADLSVIENLNFFSRAYGLTGRRQTSRVDWALEEFQLTAYRDATSGDLPLGYKQRLALAAALMHEPKIIFLDEPTSGVDPLARREFWHRINLLSESGVTILATTHFMEEADYCDRLVVLFEGEVMAEGTPDEMKSRYQEHHDHRPSMEETFVDMINERQRP